MDLFSEYYLLDLEINDYGEYTPRSSRLQDELRHSSTEVLFKKSKICKCAEKIHFFHVI